MGDSQQIRKNGPKVHDGIPSIIIKKYNML